MAFQIHKRVHNWLCKCQHQADSYHKTLASIKASAIHQILSKTFSAGIGTACPELSEEPPPNGFAWRIAAFHFTGPGSLTPIVFAPTVIQGGLLQLQSL